ncbi:hypothetical protein Tco_1107528 [Tanacetum coccineum]
MAIPKEIMSDTIKASADYLNYLAKSMGTQSGKGPGKGMITKKGVEVDVQKKETIMAPKKKRTKTIFEKIGPSKELADTVNMEIDEGTHDQSTMKLKGVENVSSEGSSMVQETPNDSSDSSSSSHSGSNNKEGFLHIDDEELKDKSDDKRTKTDNSEDEKMEIRKLKMTKLEQNKL